MCKKTIYYERVYKAVDLKNPNSFSVGDILAFKGNLYKDEAQLY